MTEDGQIGSRFDLDAYLRRIGYAGEPRPSADILSALHVAHATHIPFENLDILLNRPIRIDITSVQQKLVANRRGGYCFEQNLLFATALEAIGFKVARLGARVNLGSDVRRARTHMMLIVEADDERWLCDVGFGATGPLLPVAFDRGDESTQHAWTFRVGPLANGEYLLESRAVGAWTKAYTFTLEPQHPVDYEMANHYTSTYPSSPFTQILIAQRIAVDCRRVLRNLELTEDRGSSTTRRTLADDDEVLDVLAQKFDLRFPAGTRFQYRDPVMM